MDVNLADEEAVFLQVAMDIGATDEAVTSTFGPLLPGVASRCSSPPQPETIGAGKKSEHIRSTGVQSIQSIIRQADHPQIGTVQ